MSDIPSSLVPPHLCSHVHFFLILIFEFDFIVIFTVTVIFVFIVYYLLVIFIFLKYLLLFIQQGPAYKGSNLQRISSALSRHLSMFAPR